MNEKYVELDFHGPKADKTNLQILREEAAGIRSEAATDYSTLTALIATCLKTADLDSQPADDSETAVTSKWIYDTIYKAFKPKTSSTKTASYTILDDDGYETIYWGSHDANDTFTLPTAADNTDRELTVMNVNPYAYEGSSDNSRKVTLDGEGAETINDQASIDIERYGCGVRIKCDGTGWYIFDTIGPCELGDISGTWEMLYYKYFLGTTTSSSTTNIPHGVDWDKIVSCVGSLHDGTNPAYRYYDLLKGTNSTACFYLSIDSTKIFFAGVGSDFYNQNYRITIKYYI